MVVNKSLRDRILKATTLDTTNVLSDSLLFKDKDYITTPVPMVNVALSGKYEGGLLPGLLQLAGPSKHFKTAFGLLLVKSFLTKYPDGIIIFYDSEFGTPESYFQTFAINPENIVHSPILNVEELKFDITAQLKGLTKDDHVMIFVDSIGNLASLKEVEDAESQKSVADMSRAKQIKSVFRIITPHLVLKGIPMVVVNHTYKEIGLFPKDIVGGGTGAYLSSNDIWIIGRRQDKDQTTKIIEGFNFIINIEKSRTVREGSKIPITVTFEDGILKYSGLLDLAIEAGLIDNSKKGTYVIVGDKTQEKWKESEIINYPAFWDVVITPEFKTWIENKYKLPETMIVKEDIEDVVTTTN